MILSPAAWTPRKIPDLVLWISASTGVSLNGSSVTAVSDKSGHANDMTAVGTVSYVASEINGRPGMRFARGGYLRNTTNRLFPQNGPRHIFAVVKPTTGLDSNFTSGGIILATPNVATNITYFGAAIYKNAATRVCSDGTAQATLVSNPTIDNTAMIYEISGADGTGAGKLAFSLSGAPIALVDAIKNSETDAASFSIGSFAYYATNYPFAGSICDVLAFARVLTAQEASSVRFSLGVRYAIIVS
jgi:hypothetical protein